MPTVEGAEQRLRARAADALQCREGPGSAGRFCRAGVRSTGPLGSAPRRCRPSAGTRWPFHAAAFLRACSSPWLVGTCQLTGCSRGTTVLMVYSQALMGYSQVPSARWRLTLSATSLPGLVKLDSPGRNCPFQLRSPLLSSGIAFVLCAPSSLRVRNLSPVAKLRIGLARSAGRQQSHFLKAEDSNTDRWQKWAAMSPIPRWNARAVGRCDA